MKSPYVRHTGFSRCGIKHPVWGGNCVGGSMSIREFTQDLLLFTKEKLTYQAPFLENNQHMNDFRTNRHESKKKNHLFTKGFGHSTFPYVIPPPILDSL